MKLQEQKIQILLLCATQPVLGIRHHETAQGFLLWPDAKSLTKQKKAEEPRI